MNFSHILTATIRGRRFKLRWRKPSRQPRGGDLEFVGECDHPKSKGCELTIWPKQEPIEILGTVIHECAHGAFPDLDEDSVNEFETDTMRFLKRMGIKVEFVGKK